MSRKKFEPSERARSLMIRLFRTLKEGSIILGYAHPLEFFTPYARYRKHQDESIAVMVPQASRLTGQETALLLRYFGDTVRIIPFENDGPTSLIGYAMSRHTELVVADRPFVPSFRKSFSRNRAVWRDRTWRDMVPPSAFCDH